MYQDNRLVRRNEFCLDLPHSHGFPVQLFATEEVPLETKGVDELLRLTELADTLSILKTQAPDYFGDVDPVIEKISATPDFHKGAGIPIGTVLSTNGFVVPQAIGNDVNCGMRLMTTGLSRDQVADSVDAIEHQARHVFFAGGRDIPMTSRQRKALIHDGLPGLLQTAGDTEGMGIWQQFDANQELQKLDCVHHQGGFATSDAFALDDYLSMGEGIAYDNLIGSLGGGNHFAEIQYVKKIHDGYTANAWGLKENQVVMMIHCGSLGLGHIPGQWFQDQLRLRFPSGVAHPENGIYPLPIVNDLYKKFMRSMHNAANFAFGNRFLLAQMLRKSIANVVGEFDVDTVYDAPHNLMWQTEANQFVHRKGASPARGWESMQDTPFAMFGEPVIVPGSMGASSWLLAGQGLPAATASSCHGAGRALSRSDAGEVDDAKLDEFLTNFKVVTPVDPNRQDIRQQKHVIKAWRDALKREAPFAYKSITPVIDTLATAKMAKPVAELYPLMTVKG